MNSRQKGKRGELELVKYLKSWGVNARRGQQHRGGPDSPDIIHDIPGVHIECKRCEDIDIGTKALQEAVEQALHDARSENAIVFWKKNSVQYRGKDGKFHRTTNAWRVSATYLRPFMDDDGNIRKLVYTVAADDWMRAMGYERKTT
jgi:Holliday junction resolvase